MFTPLAKLAIGLSATMATAFYYVAAAPPASAQYVCGPGNYSRPCWSINGRAPAPQPSPVIADPVQEPVVESPAVIADPVQEPATEPAQTAPTGYLGNIYPPRTYVKPTAIPEPGTVVALLVTGAGILCSARKRNKQVRQQR